MIETDLLACPACRGQLEAAADRLVCRSCGHVFDVQEGVPVLLDAPAAGAPQSAPGPVGRAVASIVAFPPVYDLVQHVAGAEEVFRRVRPLLEQSEGRLVLDVGAGTGSAERLLPPPARYVWLDSDAQKLAGFRARSSSSAVLADATAIPLTDGAVDWAISIGVSHHLDDAALGLMLDEVRRVTRERLLFLDAVEAPRLASRVLWRYDRGRYPRSADVLKREIAARFAILTDEEFTLKHHYLLVTAVPGAA